MNVVTGEIMNKIVKMAVCWMVILVLFILGYFLVPEAQIDSPDSSVRTELVYPDNRVQNLAYFEFKDFNEIPDSELVEITKELGNPCVESWRGGGDFRIRFHFKMSQKALIEFMGVLLDRTDVGLDNIKEFEELSSRLFWNKVKVARSDSDNYYYFCLEDSYKL
jgi:hypothetical protein